MIKGIPYFGEDTQEITEYILLKPIDKEVKANSLYNLIDDNISNKALVVIDNKYLTWLNDIVFNYRDKTCYIPYYSYELHELLGKEYRSNNKGHLILKDNSLYIRYNYSYEKRTLNELNKSIIVYNLDTSEKIKYSIDKWINETEFNIEHLYRLYVDSCYKEDDYLYTKHDGGYHYISKSIKSFKNKEKQIRNRLGLNDYKENNIEKIENTYRQEHYRDVRAYRYNEFTLKGGLTQSTEQYKIRKLRFETYLYCILRQHISPDNTDLKFKEQFNKLVNGNIKYIKYSNEEHRNIKLIIKEYWLDNKSKPDKTYLK